MEPQLSPKFKQRIQRQLKQRPKRQLRQRPKRQLRQRLKRPQEQITEEYKDKGSKGPRSLTISKLEEVTMEEKLTGREAVSTRGQPKAEPDKLMLAQLNNQPNQLRLTNNPDPRTTIPTIQIETTNNTIPTNRDILPQNQREKDAEGTQTETKEERQTIKLDNRHKRT